MSSKPTSSSTCHSTTTLNSTSSSPVLDIQHRQHFSLLEHAIWLDLWKQDLEKEPQKEYCMKLLKEKLQQHNTPTPQSMWVCKHFSCPNRINAEHAGTILGISLLFLLFFFSHCNPCIIFVDPSGWVLESHHFLRSTTETLHPQKLVTFLSVLAVSILFIYSAIQRERP